MVFGGYLEVSDLVVLQGASGNFQGVTAAFEGISGAFQMLTGVLMGFRGPQRHSRERQGILRSLRDVSEILTGFQRGSIEYLGPFILLKCP